MVSIGGNRYRVIFETVGQYTFADDKHRVPIFEDDIVKVFIQGAQFITVVKWGERSRGWMLKCDRTKIDEWGTIKYYAIPSSKHIEVIGNIHDGLVIETGEYKLYS
jgi:uncharacterized phage protein (TIGR01671 family)